MNVSYTIFYTTSSTYKESVKMLTNPGNMIPQKKLLALKFEYSHFEPLINSLLAPFLAI